MLFQKINVEELIKSIKKNKLSSYFFLDNLYIEYLTAYNSSSLFLDISFQITNENNILLCPITIEKKNNKKYLNFFGRPFFCIYKNIDKKLFKFFAQKIEEIIKKEQIEELNFLIEKPFNDKFEINSKLLEKNFIKKVSNIKYINLELEINEIKQKFKKGLKYVLNKKYPELVYEIIDAKNYTNEILEMQNMHKEISNNITRSDNTWMINEKMILFKKGFLTKVILNNKTISYSLFFNNKLESNYFSSCTHRNFFKEYQNITHRSILEAIKYLKKIECKKLTLGETKILFSEDMVTDKEKNIATFKSAFGGVTYINYYFKKFNFDLFDLYLK